MIFSLVSDGTNIHAPIPLLSIFKFATVQFISVYLSPFRYQLYIRGYFDNWVCVELNSLIIGSRNNQILDLVIWALGKKKKKKDRLGAKARYPVPSQHAGFSPHSLNGDSVLNPIITNT